MIPEPQKGHSVAIFALFVFLAVQVYQLSLLILVKASVYTSKKKEEKCGLNLDLFNSIVSQLEKLRAY